MSRRLPRGKPAEKDPGFTLIEITRPGAERIAEAIVYLLTRRHSHTSRHWILAFARTVQGRRPPRERGSDERCLGRDDC